MADLTKHSDGLEPVTAKSFTTSYTSGLASAWSKKMDENMMVAMGLVKLPPPRKLTAKEKRQLWIKQRTPRAIYRKLGERFTRYLMNKFDIYEGDY